MGASVDEAWDMVLLANSLELRSVLEAQNHFSLEGSRMRDAVEAATEEYRD